MDRTSAPFSRLRGRRGLIVAVLSACVVATTAARGVEPVAGGYAPDVAYGRGSLVIGSDGNVYRALDSVKGKDPVTVKDATWQLAHAAFDVTLDVPGRFPSIENGFEFIAGATISDTATVTVQLAQGTHELIRSLSIGHTQGGRVCLKGGKDARKYVLDAKNGNAIVIDHGTMITLEGFTIEGDDRDTIGVSVENRSAVFMRRLVIKDFRMGVSVGRSSHLDAEDVTVTSTRGDAGFHAFSGSSCVLRDCSATLQANPRSTEIHMGFAAWFSSTIECFGCTATGWHDGFFAGNASSIDLRKCTAVNNRYGGDAYLNSSLRAVECVFEASRSYGINLHQATGVVVSSEFRDNREIAMRCYGASMIDLRGRPCEIIGSPVGLQSIAGGVFVGVKPTIQGPSRLYDVYRYQTSDDAVFQFAK